jgi:hypothetical protein
LIASSPLDITSNVISISKSDATTNGYLSSGDWIAFNSKQDANTAKVVIAKAFSYYTSLLIFICSKDPYK